MYNGIDLLLEAAEQLENEEELEEINKKWTSLLPKPDGNYEWLADSEFLAKRIKKYTEIPILPNGSVKRINIGKAPEIILFISPGIKYYLGSYDNFYHMLIKEENGHKSLVRPELSNAGKMVTKVPYGFLSIQRMENHFYYEVCRNENDVFLYDNNNGTATLGYINNRGFFYSFRIHGFY